MGRGLGPVSISVLYSPPVNMGGGREHKEVSMSVDPNIKRKMLEQGYEPDVIEWMEKERVAKLREEFVQKNVILGRFYQQKVYYEFIADVFPGLEEFMVVTGDKGFQKMDADELCEYQSDRDNVYVVPASFINDYYSGATCKDMYALVVDVDRIKPQTLDAIIKNGNLGLHIPMPTYITNSGSGIHLYYVFKHKVPYYVKNRKILGDMYRKLCGITKQRIAAKTDWHSVVQPFRLPGSMTKLGQIVTGYRCGDKWRVQDLASRLNVDYEELDMQERPLLPQDEYLKRKAERMDSGERKKPKRSYKLREGNAGFYEYCLSRCFEETEEGNRYMSMVGLSVVAYKVGVEKEKLEEDLTLLLEHYNDIGATVTWKEMKKAMRAYNFKAIKCRSETLEQWFGWEFRRFKHVLSKGRSQEEHLKRARAVRAIASYENVGAPTKEQIVRNWREENPEGTPKECIAATGISKNTVYKWWNGLKTEPKTKKDCQNQNPVPDPAELSEAQVIEMLEILRKQEEVLKGIFESDGESYKDLSHLLELIKKKR